MKRTINIILCAFALLISSGCDKLEQNPFDNLSSKNLSQNVKITYVDELSVNNFNNPQFGTSNNLIYLTNKDKSGIWVFNTDKRELKQITSTRTADGNYLVSNDDKNIFYILKARRPQEDDFIYTLVKQTISTGSLEIVTSTKNRLTNLNGNDDIVSYIEKTSDQNSLKIINIGLGNGGSAVNFYDNTLIFRDSTGQREIQPLGPVRIGWIDVSRNNELLVYGSGLGTAVIESNGEVERRLNQTNFAKWSPDGNVIAFIKENNSGMNDIFLTDKNDKEIYNITKTENISESSAAWSGNGKKIVFHTDDGKIGIISFN